MFRLPTLAGSVLAFVCCLSTGLIGDNSAYAQNGWVSPGVGSWGHQDATPFTARRSFEDYVQQRKAEVASDLARRQQAAEAANEARLAEERAQEAARHAAEEARRRQQAEAQARAAEEARAAQERARAEEAERERAEAAVRAERERLAAIAQAQQEALAVERAEEWRQWWANVYFYFRMAVGIGVVVCLFLARETFARWYYLMSPHPAAHIVEGAIASRTPIDGRALSTVMTPMPGSRTLQEVRATQARDLAARAAHHTDQLRAEAERVRENALRETEYLNAQEALARAAEEHERAQARLAALLSRRHRA